MFSFFSSLVWLTLYWYCKEKFCLGHSWELKGEGKKSSWMHQKLSLKIKLFGVSEDGVWSISPLKPQFCVRSHLENVILTLATIITMNPLGTLAWTSSDSSDILVLVSQPFQGICFKKNFFIGLTRTCSKCRGLERFQK